MERFVELAKETRATKNRMLANAVRRVADVRGDLAHAEIVERAARGAQQKAEEDVRIAQQALASWHAAHPPAATAGVPGPPPAVAGPSSAAPQLGIAAAEPEALNESVGEIQGKCVRK